MFEFGHHVTRIFFSKDAAKLLTDTETVNHMEIKGFKLQPFKWYEVLAEVGESKLFVQIKNESGKITKFYCDYPKLKEAKSTSFQIASTIQGTLKMDEFKVWESKGLKNK